MLFCTICGERFAWHRACDQMHAGVCHECHALNMAGNTLERQEHLAPETPLVLSPRDVQALVRYRIHREAVLGTGACTPVGREDTPC